MTSNLARVVPTGVTRAQLARLDGDPDAVREWVFTTPDVIADLVQEKLLRSFPAARYALATHPYLTEEVELALAADPSPRVRNALSRNPVLGDAAVTELLRQSDAGDVTPEEYDSETTEHGEFDDWDVWSNPYFLASFRESLVRHLDHLSDARIEEVLTCTSEVGPAGRTALARRLDVTSDVLVRILRIGDADLCALASHPELPTEVGRELVRHPDSSVRAMLAANPSIGRDYFSVLLQDPSDHVVWCLARNPTLTPSDIDVLMNRTDVDVAPVASNPSATVTQLRELARRDLDFFGEDLAHHPDLPLDLLALIFSGAAGPSAAEAACAHPRLPRPLMEQAVKDWPTRVRLAGNPSLPLDLQRVLAASDDSTQSCLEGNESLAPDESFPAQFLRRIDHPLAAAPDGVDPSTWEALLEGWDGSLESLVVTAHSLGPSRK